MSKLKIDTLGCCILRDVFRISDAEKSRVELNRNIGFISPMSMFSKPIVKKRFDVGEGVEPDNKEHFEESLSEIIYAKFNEEGIANFVIRNCFLDLNKTIFEYLYTEHHFTTYVDNNIAAEPAVSGLL